MKKGSSGNTLTLVLVILIVVSILSMAIVYAVAYSSNAKLKSSSANFKMVTLENEAYLILNKYIENQNLDEIVANPPFSANFKELLEAKKLSDNSFMIRFKTDSEGFLIEFDMLGNGYEIKKWGMTQWT